MKLSTALGCLVLSLASTGCGAFGEKKVDPNYQLLMDTMREIRVEEARARQEEAKAKAATLSSLADRCSTPECVTQLAMTITLSDAVSALKTAGNGGAQNQQLPVYQKPRSGWATAGDWILRLAGIAVPEWRMDRQGKYSLQATQAQYAFLGGVVGNVTDAAVAMQPSITVGGNYNTGTYTDIEGGYIGGNVDGPGAGIGNTFYQDNTVATSGNYNNVGDGNTQDNSQGQINGDNNRVTSPDDIDNSTNDNRECVAGNGAPGGNGTSTTGNSPGGSGAPGGSASCGG